MIRAIEYFIGIAVIVWFIDHIILKGKHTTRFWLIFDITLIFLVAMKWILGAFI